MYQAFEILTNYIFILKNVATNATSRISTYMKNRTSKIWKLPKFELQKLLDESSRITEILIKLGYDGYNGNHRTLKQRIKEDNICLFKFKENQKKWRKDFLTNKAFKSKKPDDLVFCENSTYASRSDLKKRLLKKGIEYKCSKCLNDGNWCDEVLSLQLDHINGINNDNRIENLRFLCPNCHSQTKNFSGKNSNQKKDTTCIKCSSPINNKSKKCRICASQERFKINWPNNEELCELLKKYNFTEISKKLKVSRTTVMRHLKRNKIWKG